MECNLVNVIDTSVKIGLGTLIAAVSSLVTLMLTQRHEREKEKKERFYRLQDEKKSKYVELLVQSQELIQCHLYSSCSPDSDAYKKYLRSFNEVQIISSDSIRIAAYNLVSDTQAFIFLNKNEQEIELVDNMVKSAREKVSIFQKIAQDEVTKCYQKT